MKCPVCNVSLVMSERSGVEIDYCPDCRGIWLDRGELDKIIERVDGGGSGGGRQEQSERKQSRDEEDDEDERYEKRGRDSYNQPVKKKKERGGFLGDLLDFGG